MPWAYFLVVNVGPIRVYDEFGTESVGSSGVLGFIEFYGLPDAVIIYAKVAMAFALLILFACFVHDVIAGKFTTKP